MEEKNLRHTFRQTNLLFSAALKPSNEDIKIATLRDKGKHGSTTFLDCAVFTIHWYASYGKSPFWTQVFLVLSYSRWRRAVRFQTAQIILRSLPSRACCSEISQWWRLRGHSGSIWHTAYIIQSDGIRDAPEYSRCGVFVCKGEHQAVGVAIQILSHFSARPAVVYSAEMWLALSFCQMNVSPLILSRKLSVIARQAAFERSRWDAPIIHA